MYKEFFTKNSMDDQIIMKISNPCIQRNKPVERLNKREKKKKRQTDFINHSLLGRQKRLIPLPYPAGHALVKA